MKTLFNNTEKIKINLNLTKQSKKIIKECIDKNIFYAVFPIKGDSMTCNDLTKSIPNGSKVLAIDTQIKVHNGISNVWHEIPKHKTLLIKGTTNKGFSFFVCKSITSIDAVNGYVLFNSYNTKHQSKWIPFNWIDNIFEVIQIIK